MPGGVRCSVPSAAALDRTFRRRSCQPCHAHVLHEQLRVDPGRQHCIRSLKPVEVLVADEEHEVGVVVGDLDRLLVDRVARVRVELGAALVDQVGQLLVGVRRSDAAGLRSTCSAGGRVEQVVRAGHEDRVLAVLAVEQDVEVGAELGRLQVDLEAGLGPVAGDRLDEVAVVEPAPDDSPTRVIVWPATPASSISCLAWSGSYGYASSVSLWPRIDGLSSWPLVDLAKPP